MTRKRAPWKTENSFYANHRPVFSHGSIWCSQHQNFNTGQTTPLWSALLPSQSFLTGKGSWGLKRCQMQGGIENCSSATMSKCEGKGRFCPADLAQGRSAAALSVPPAPREQEGNPQTTRAAQLSAEDSISLSSCTTNFPPSSLGREGGTPPWGFP